MFIYLFACEGVTLRKKWKYGKAVVCGRSHVLRSPVKQAAYLVSVECIL